MLFSSRRINKLLKGVSLATFGIWQIALGVGLMILPEITEAKKPKALKGPWLTGPLLATAGITEDPGEFDAEPYLFNTKTYSVPRIFAIIPTLSFTAGLAKRLDTEAVIPYTFDSVGKDRGGNLWDNHFQDIMITLGFQAIKTETGDPIPNIRVVLQETFPSGRFQNLSGNNPVLQSSGAGSYQTGIGTNFGQYYLLPNGKYLNLLLNLTATFPSNVNVHGFNTYGGGLGTDGTVKVGDNYYADFAFEYTMTQHWILALDTTYTYSAPDPFRGITGFNLDSSPASVGTFTSQQVTLAPAIEYNFNEHWGVIGGMWFTVFVHNSNNFVSGVVALNYGS